MRMTPWGSVRVMIEFVEGLHRCNSVSIKKENESKDNTKEQALVWSLGPGHFEEVLKSGRVLVDHVPQEK